MPSSASAWPPRTNPCLLLNGQNQTQGIKKTHPPSLGRHTQAFQGRPHTALFSSMWMTSSLPGISERILQRAQRPSSNSCRTQGIKSQGTDLPTRPILRLPLHPRKERTRARLRTPCLDRGGQSHLPRDKDHLGESTSPWSAGYRKCF